MTTRRTLLATATALGGAMALSLAGAAFAQSADHSYDTDAGQITIHPVEHASFVMETPAGTIYADPVGDASVYSQYPTPDLILLTSEHGDHFSPDTLSALVGEETQLITPSSVYDMLPENLSGMAMVMANGDRAEALGIPIEAIPAYNTTEERLQFHPKGRDNGYVLNIGGKRVYIAGDTEDIPEMRALKDIDIAFVPMNLPYTMDVDQAASAVAEFAPAYVYPYHYGDSDIDQFASLMADSGAETEVVRHNWYPDAE